MTTVAVLVSLIVALAIQPIIIRQLRRHSVFDVPNHRSSHTGLIPRGGGIAIAVAVAAAVTATYLSGMAELSTTAVALLILTYGFAALGLVDDVLGLSAVPRLCVQLILAAMATLLLIYSSAGHVLALVVTSAASVIWIVGYTNAFNFMDGINGISCLSSSLTMGYFAWLGHSIGSDDSTLIALAFCGASLGFLPWNFPRARAFLGDVGSYFLGSTAAILALKLCLEGAMIPAALAPLALYGADTSSTLLRRVSRGEAWQEGHRDHVYQRLATSWGHTATSVYVALLTLGLLGAGFLFTLHHAIAGSVVGVGLTASFLGAPAMGRYLRTRLRSNRLPARRGTGALTRYRRPRL